jgi:hypothetical protein
LFFNKTQNSHNRLKRFEADKKGLDCDRVAAAKGSKSSTCWIFWLAHVAEAIPA